VLEQQQVQQEQLVRQQQEQQQEQLQHGAAAGATGAGASFLPQAAKEIANKEAINSDFFILFP